MIRAITSALALFGFLFVSISTLANEGTIAFVGATIIDGTDAEPLEDGVLVVTEGRVSSVCILYTSDAAYDMK